MTVESYVGYPSGVHGLSLSAFVSPHSKILNLTVWGGVAVVVVLVAADFFDIAVVAAA